MKTPHDLIRKIRQRVQAGVKYAAKLSNLAGKTETISKTIAYY